MKTAQLRGICEQCICEFGSRALVLQVRAGGTITGIHCAHNETIAYRRQQPDGTVGQWRLHSPAGPEFLKDRMGFLAGIAQGMAELRAAGTAAELLERAAGSADPVPSIERLQ